MISGTHCDASVRLRLNKRYCTLMVQKIWIHVHPEHYSWLLRFRFVPRWLHSNGFTINYFSLMKVKADRMPALVKDTLISSGVHFCSSIDVCDWRALQIYIVGIRECLVTQVLSNSYWEDLVEPRLLLRAKGPEMLRNASSSVVLWKVLRKCMRSKCSWTEVSFP